MLCVMKGILCNQNNIEGTMCAHVSVEDTCEVKTVKQVPNESGLTNPLERTIKKKRDFDK